MKRSKDRGKFKALLSPVVLLNIGSVMTLFEPDLPKPPGRLLPQYDTWEVVSRGVLQNVYFRLPRTKSGALGTGEYKICCSACKRVHVTWDLAAQPLLAKEEPLLESRSKEDFAETGRRLADRWYKKLKMPPLHGVPPI
ncbi:hypothetical protein V8E54_008719 [Elaphomyces granulatus]